MIRLGAHSTGWTSIGVGGGEFVGRVYHRCYFCGGEVVEQLVTTDYRWGPELLAVIRNVPAGICQVCGEQYLKAEVVKAMERLAHTQDPPEGVLRVPVRHLKVA